VQPIDSLDLVLASDYDHHTQWMADKAWTLRQPASHSRTIKDEVKAKTVDIKQTEVELLLHHDVPRDVLHHVPINIPCNHLPSTLRGFGRKAN